MREDGRRGEGKIDGEGKEEQNRKERKKESIEEEERKRRTDEKDWMRMRMRKMGKEGRG